jgi:hypothetical protein
LLVNKIQSTLEGLLMPKAKKKSQKAAPLKPAMRHTTELASYPTSSGSDFQPSTK